MGIKGKSAIVTGGTKGIGRAIALRLAGDGGNVAVLGRDQEAATRTAAEVEKQGVKSLALKCDVTDYGQVKRVMSEVHQAWGSLDILINNAGMDRSQVFQQTDKELWDLLIDVNYKSFLNCCHVCIPYMIENKSGNIVNLGSDAGRVGNPGEVLYCGTKAAVMASGKALARELARYNIRVNSVAPGPVQTELWENLHPGEKGRKVTEAVTRAIPMHRIGTPEEVADVVAFFVSDDSRYLTGQVLSVDGGLTMIG
ncbi:MAG: SDR family oxidoreductase [Desulfohalobiaceae bacterium]|nr:SDR family oxidoreductase [Desulfohalobiaceae bacterium]